MNVPKLRFPEFSGEWEEKKLNKIFYKITKRNTDKKNTNVITNSATEGLISQRDYFDKDIANIEKTDNYFVIQNGDFVYNPRKSSSAPYGPFTQYKLTNDGIVSPLYLCLRKIESTVDSKFLENYFKTSCWHQYIYENGSAGARHDRVSIHDDILLEMPLKIPSLPEQQKIADFLSTVDSIIASETKILNALQKKKKALMQKLFSQQLRFKADDGSEFPEWVEKKLGDCVDILDKQRKPIESKERANRKGKYPYYGASGIIDYIDDYIFEGESILLGEDGANIINRNSRLAYIASGKYWVNNHAHIMKAINGNLNYYICEYLESLDYSKKCAGSAQPKLTQEIVRDLDMNLPCKEEQQKIADCLSNLDNLIQNQQKIVSNWQHRKKALLQQMFI